MTDIRRPAKQAPKLGSEIITVRVGPCDMSKDFSIHSVLLRDGSSDFFAAALRGGWRESIEGVIALPEVSPDYFEIYFGWLYYRKIHSSPDEDPEGEADSGAASEALSAELSLLFSAGSWENAS